MSILLTVLLPMSAEITMGVIFRYLRSDLVTLVEADLPSSFSLPRSLYRNGRGDSSMVFPLSSARGPFWSNTSDGVDYISRVALIMVYVPSVPQKEFVNLTIPDGLFELIFQSETPW